MTSYTNVTTTYPEGANTPIKRVKRNGPPSPNPPTSAQAKNFILGDEWLDVTGGDWWKLASNPTGGVLWVRIGGTGGSDIAQITPDSGAAVIGIANNIFSTGFPVGTTNLKGIKTFNGGGAGDVLEFQNLRDLSRYVVGANANESQFTSIQTAINTAMADGFNTANPTVVYILPGTYIEDLTLQPGISLAGVSVSAESMTILIQGAAILNPAAGTNTFSATGVTFATNGAASPAFSIQGANAISVFFNDCGFIGNSGTAYETISSAAQPKHSSCFYSAAAGQKVWNLAGTEDLFINCLSSFTDTKSTISQKCSFLDCTLTDSFDCINGANPLFFNSIIISNKFPATNFEAVAIDATSFVGILDCFLDTSSPTGFSVTGTGTLGYNVVTAGQPFDPALSIFGFTTFTGNLSFDGGTNTIDTDGELIIGNTGNPPSINTLTAGTGIAITNGPGTITIAISSAPTFISYQLADVPNATGNGVNYQVVCDFAPVNVGGGYSTATGVFTAPLTGTYSFSGEVNVSNLAVGNISMFVEINQSTGDIWRLSEDPLSPATLSTDGSGSSVLIFMTAGDTAFLTANVQGAPQTVTVRGNGTGKILTYFSGTFLYPP